RLGGHSPPPLYLRTHLAVCRPQRRDFARFFEKVIDAVRGADSIFRIESEGCVIWSSVMTKPGDLESIFLAALQKGSAAGRARCLADACRDSPQLRPEVERLLAAHPGVGSFLESASAAGPFLPTITGRPVAEGPGTVVGPYKLLEQIGEGGFGVV